MGLLGRILIRIAFSVSVVVLFVFNVLKVTTPADMFNSALLIFAIISTSILMDKYMSRESETE